ncbi:MAG: BREX system P-loop protein BrxC [Clostridia bacterium]|nr:BREX system P-loop protein BrxC [Clostridia bacterium]
MNIKDILTIDLAEDIKNVIDLEDVSEAEIQTEIENYIVTDGLARDYVDFVATFSSNIVETGAWISGFYGSGKSYFAKLLGYLLSNRDIAGTPARDRILQRFTGINDESLIKNSIARLNTENCRVVFLDVAKQDTSKGLAYTLFRNFLKSLDLPENEHGFFLYQLIINDNQTNIYDYIDQNLGKNWSKIKTRLLEYTKATKTIYLQAGNSESDYENLMTTIRRDIDQFSSSRLKDELNNYLQINNDEKIIFLFDEASEAINQQKFSLLDLEGISESLSSLGAKVWTIAIAQEKLDDVINNSNVSKAQLTKVTDRFKTKIHLEATEVDVIIRNRLLNKNTTAIEKLKDHYTKNSGKISDHAALNGNGISKTETLEGYITYYPFYEYQFNLLQNFLFGTKGYASTKVAARGMIITTYDILKREIAARTLFDTVTGWQITKQAQPQPAVRLVNRYDNAERILKNNHSSISGRKLLETIHFLTEAEVAPATITNIIKSYISDPENFHKVHDDIVKALEDLVEAKILFLANNTYSITSDIELRLLDEMNGFAVQGFVKKKQVVTSYKASAFVRTLARIIDDNLPYDFHITTDNDDELTNPAKKDLKIKLKSVYNLSDNRAADIDTVKVQTQNDKDIIWLLPDNGSFSEMDKLIDEIQRITYLEEKYNNPQSDEAGIMRSFSTAKGEKETRLQELVEQCLYNATAVYLYNTYQLDKNTWQTTLQTQQRSVIQNVYDKRLTAQLSDEVAVRVIKESNNTHLKSFFAGPEFKFFDAQGNFIGENLKAAGEILYKIRNTFVDGDTLAKELEKPPTGFTFGTVISTVAAFMRGGKVMAKYNGAEKFSWRDEGVSAIFANAREFRKASFKAVAKSLSAQQKNEIVTMLQDLKCEENTGKKIDWNTNDFDLVNAVRELAKRFYDKVDDMRKQNKDFDKLFAEINEQKDILGEFTGAVSEANYIEKAEDFLKNQESFSKAIKAVEKVEKFIRNNLPKLRVWKTFATGVEDELSKSAKTNIVISQLGAEFNILYGKEVVKNYVSLQQTAQKIKDEYFGLMSSASKDMAEKYSQLKTAAEQIIDEINRLPAGLNDISLVKSKTLLHYAEQRTQTNVDIDFEVKDKHSHFTYSEMLSFNELFNGKKTDLEIIKASLIKEAPPEPKHGDPKPVPVKQILTTTIPGQKLKVSEYKQWLQQELQKLAAANDDDEIEVKKG